jgi:hypothetical protein
MTKINFDSLENEISRQMQETLSQRDPGRFARLGKLNALAQHLEDIKKEVSNIEAGLTQNPEATAPPSSSSCDIPISQGDLNQNLLKIKIPKRLGLVPSEGIDFRVNARTSKGDFNFTTQIDPITHSRLKARSEIARFYRDAGIKAGDSIRWEKADSMTFQMSKI